jgi:hypothetical protein
MGRRTIFLLIVIFTIVTPSEFLIFQFFRSGQETYLTMLAVLAAVFIGVLPRIYEKYDQPEFEVEFKDDYLFYAHDNPNIKTVCPHCSHEDIGDSVRWISIKVRNRGGSVAKQCRGRLVSIEDSSTGKPREDFMPAVLQWVNSPPGQPIQITSIGEYLNLFFVTRYDPRIHIAAIKWRTTSVNFCPPVRNYILTVELYGENLPPIIRSFDLQGGGYDQIKLSARKS